MSHRDHFRDQMLHHTMALPSNSIEIDADGQIKCESSVVCAATTAGTSELRYTRTAELSPQTQAPHSLDRYV